MAPIEQSTRGSAAVAECRGSWNAVLLLVVPSWRSDSWRAIDWRLWSSLPAALSLFTFISYWSDKRRAEAGEWRVPESTLHLVEFLGGWPGAFLSAGAFFRHKIAKGSFQFAFWFHRLGPRVFRRRIPFGLALSRSFLSASSNHKRPNRRQSQRPWLSRPRAASRISK